MKRTAIQEMRANKLDILKLSITVDSIERLQ